MVVAEKHPQADFLLHDAFTRNIYFAKGEDGRTLVQAYLEDEAGKLKNDDMGPFKDWFAACRQPLLLRLMMMRARDYEEEKPGSFTEHSLVPMELALCYAAALINLLCAKLDRVPRRSVIKS